MEFNYRGKHYILGEMYEPNKNISYDMIAIFEYINEKYIFINYFYGADDEDENLIKIAKEYIDMKEGKR